MIVVWFLYKNPPILVRLSLVSYEEDLETTMFTIPVRSYDCCSTRIVCTIVVEDSYTILIRLLFKNYPILVRRS